MSKIFVAGDAQQLTALLQPHDVRDLKPHQLECGIDGISLQVTTQQEISQICDWVNYQAIPDGTRDLHASMDYSDTGYLLCAIPSGDIGLVTNPRMEHMDWCGSRRALAHILLLSLAKTLRRPVQVKVPHGKRTSCSSPDAFTINFWSSATEHGREREITPPSTIWGIRRGCGDSAFHASGAGVSIMDEVTGYCVAELFENDLMIHHDLCHFDTYNEISILAKLLERVKELRAKKSARVKKRAIDPAIVTQDFVALCQRSYRQVLDQTKKGITKESRELEKALKKTRSTIDKLTGKRDLLVATKPDDTQFVATLKKLREHPKVTTVNVLHGVIEVETARLYALDPTTHMIHRLGRQTVTIHPDGKNGGVRFVGAEGNISGTGRAALHCSKAGHVIHPEVIEAITELLALRKFDEALDVAIQAVTTLELVDVKRQAIAKWPLATSAELVGTEWEGTQVVAGPAA